MTAICSKLCSLFKYTDNSFKISQEQHSGQCNVFIFYAKIVSVGAVTIIIINEPQHVISNNMVF